VAPAAVTDQGDSRLCGRERAKGNRAQGQELATLLLLLQQERLLLACGC
jgi:hypothetical protein